MYTHMYIKIRNRYKAETAITYTEIFSVRALLTVAVVSHMLQYC